jgi:hypothetical protein
MQQRNGLLREEQNGRTFAVPLDSTAIAYGCSNELTSFAYLLQVSETTILLEFVPDLFKYYNFSPCGCWLCAQGRGSFWAGPNEGLLQISEMHRKQDRPCLIFNAPMAMIGRDWAI